MLVLHTVLLLRRLEAEAAEGRELGQAVFDRFCGDMDGSLREMGVGDIAVPRQMKAIGEAFYGRKRAYEAGLAAHGLEQLAQALARNVHEGASAQDASRLAAYMRDAADALAAQDGAALRRGSVAFPEPLQHGSESPLAVGTGSP